MVKWITRDVKRIPPGGDMLKSIYDPDKDGVIEGAQVDDDSKVEGETSGIREEHGFATPTYASANLLRVGVSYATAFSALPVLKIDVENATLGARKCNLHGYADDLVTGFNLECHDKDGTLVSGDTAPCNWLAIGS